MPSYRTQTGYTVKVIGGVFKSHVSCYGCNRGWRVSEKDAHHKANRHANGCRAVPANQRPAGGGVIGRARR
ncbi:MAG TPA: hypothetical protein VK659_09730 [Asanoa sp.]|nr:hypothetical protein [Asanoa sp.]